MDKLSTYKNGKVGGILVGRTHDECGKHGECGIKLINTDTNESIEAENNEVIIKASAVEDPTIHEFDGKRMTNLQILSTINKNAGGVSFFQNGGKLSCGCSGHKHNYNGEELTDVEIVKKMNGGFLNEDLTKGAIPDPLILETRFLPTTRLEPGAKIPVTLNETEAQVIEHFKNGNPNTYVSIYGKDRSSISGLIDGNVVYTTGMMNSGQMDIFLTDAGRKLLFPYRAADGVILNGPAAAPLILKQGGKISESKFYKGVHAKYNNPFEINRAIEELLDSRPSPSIEFSSEEKMFMGYYTGYGGLQKFGAEGPGLLYEYYTPLPVIEKMWGLAYKYSYKGGSVCEPACGIGDFFKYLPETTSAIGFEINKYSSRISSILYPNVLIENKYFEELFIKGNNSIKNKIEGIKKYSLVIGNPPYGAFQGKFAGIGEKQYSRATNYIDYFIFRGLDLLEPGGLLIYIVGAEVQAGGVPFLGQTMNAVKREIVNKSILLDAYRLPNGIFERTDVLTDIIVLQRK